MLINKKKSSYVIDMLSNCCMIFALVAHCLLCCTSSAMVEGSNFVSARVPAKEAQDINYETNLIKRSQVGPNDNAYLDEPIIPARPRRWPAPNYRHIIATKPWLSRPINQPTTYKPLETLDPESLRQLELLNQDINSIVLRYKKQHRAPVQTTATNVEDEATGPPINKHHHHQLVHANQLQLKQNDDLIKRNDLDEIFREKNNDQRTTSGVLGMMTMIRPHQQMPSKPVTIEDIMTFEEDDSLQPEDLVASINEHAKVDKDCSLRKFNFLARNTDADGNMCESMIETAICSGSCVTSEYPYYTIPYKRSFHSSCNFDGRILKHAKLDICSNQNVNASLRNYSYYEPINCKCKLCETNDTFCLTTSQSDGKSSSSSANDN